MTPPATLDLADDAATARLGEAVSGALRTGEAVCLTGPLGAGKSTLARALVRALTTPDEEVPSPTFTLVHEDAGRPVGQMQPLIDTGGGVAAHQRTTGVAEPARRQETGLQRFTLRTQARVLPRLRGR